MAKRGSNDLPQDADAHHEAKNPRFAADLSDDTDEAMPAPKEGGHRRWGAEAESQNSTAATTPELRPASPPNAKLAEQLSACLEHVSTSPEARARAHNSELGQLSVKELKSRLLVLGANIVGLHEKEELVELLQELVHENASQDQRGQDVDSSVL